MGAVRSFVVVAALAGASLAVTPVSTPALPTLHGWTRTQSAVSSGGGWGLPPAESTVVSEYGLQTIERAGYTRQGVKIAVVGMHFSDAGGAFGAFTYYRPADAHAVAAGNAGVQIAASPAFILIRSGRWLVRVEGNATAAQLMARTLDAEEGIGMTLPAVPFYLPRTDQIRNSLHFVEGPAGFAAACNWMSPSSVGFDRSAEAAIANYPAAQVLVISYPTPQMARTRLPQLQGLRVGEVRRSGPLLIVVHGAADAAAAALLQSVNYDAAITMTPSVPVGMDALPNLILSIFVLCGLLIAIAVGVGVLTGAARVWLDRVLPERYRRESKETLIRLNLDRIRR